MTQDRRPMPEITVRDPNRPDRPADVLVSGSDDRPPTDPAVVRRRRRLAGIALVVLALAAGGLELRDRRAQAAEQERLGAIVELRAEYDSGMSGYDPASGTATLGLTLLVHNDGPRDVTITDADLGGHVLENGPVSIRARSWSRVLLERTVQCGPQAPAATPPGGLQLTVRTPTVERQVELDLPVDDADAARLCGFRPLEALRVFFDGFSWPEPEVLEVPLDVGTTSVGPVALVAVRSQPGIAVRLLFEGRPVDLPVELTVLEGLERYVTLTVRLTVSDCTAALAPTGGPDLPSTAEDPGSSLLLQLRDASGAIADTLVGYPDGVMSSLVGESCF